MPLPLSTTIFIGRASRQSPTMRAAYSAARCPCARCGPGHRVVLGLDALAQLLDVLAVDGAAGSSPS
jgi:hypothetical protein